MASSITLPIQYKHLSIFLAKELSGYEADISLAETSQKMPQLTKADGTTANGLKNILQTMLEGTKYWVVDDSNFLQQLSIWIRYLADVNDNSIEPVLTALNTHLHCRMFFYGQRVSAVDLVVYEVLKSNTSVQKYLKKADDVPHALRFLKFLQADPTFIAAVRNHGKLRPAPAAKKAAPKKKAAPAQKAQFFDRGVALPDIAIAGAQDGKVVTRFPPEPSGFLHVGHAKAAVLNYSIAAKYHGKMVVRFDDTNPTKENQEFVDNIMADLKTLQLSWDRITYTSDSFDMILEMGTKMLQAGKAYIDKTPVDQMRDMRMEGVESVFRSQSLEENTRLWQEMQAGSEEGQTAVMRAKINMQAPNKTMRDPALFRVNLAHHHRTGDKYKVYPCYDFACPIVDSAEGITHALRTNEYHDRNEQYAWMCDALGIRKPEVWEFSRLNFMYTLLSKRKLQWFVDNGKVDGWYDPRMPTVQGMNRRGLDITALKTFMLEQGMGAWTNMTDWDKIWAINKQLIDPQVPRYSSVTVADAVPVKLSGVSDLRYEERPRHKKNPDLGSKKIALGPEILMEQLDAAAVSVGEKITLMDWGNCEVSAVHKNSDGLVTGLEGTILPDDTDFKKTQKFTWLAKDTSVPFARLRLVDFKFLISKVKLEEGDNVEDFLNDDTIIQYDAFGDPNLNGLKPGDKLQLERRGYFIVDRIEKEGDSDVIIMHMIPDGRKKTQALGGKARGKK